MDRPEDTAEPSPPGRRISLGNGLILLNLLQAILIVLIIFFPSSPLRVVLAVPFLLVFPGYTVVLAIFPRKDEISKTERVVLSVGLSVIIAALTGLALNYTRWGIRLDPILYSLASLIFLVSVIAYIRQSRVPLEERFILAWSLAPMGLRRLTPDRAISLVLVLAIIGAAGALSYIAARPGDGEAYTEFYLLGQQGQAGDYPDQLIIGEQGRTVAGILNHENIEVTYTIKVVMSGSMGASYGPIVLENDQKWEGQVSFTTAETGEDQKVEFLLFKDDDTEPYKQLHLLVDVVE